MAVTREQIEKALKEYRDGKKPIPQNQARISYYLVVDGKEYPAKYIYQLASGKDSNVFNTYSACKELEKLGYEIKNEAGTVDKKTSSKERIHRNAKKGREKNNYLSPELASSLLGYFYRTIFVNNDKENSTQRYLSWEHCYSFFRQMREKYLIKSEDMSGPDWEKDLDLMSLHLGFYLASWGMYRGSSFFLVHDYKFHKKVVEYLFKKKDLWEIDYSSSDELYNCFNLDERKKISSGFGDELFKAIQKCYFGSGRGDIDKSSVDSEESEVSMRNITQTQLTKILLGTCGCIPAYDRYFCEGARQCGFSGTLSSDSFEELVDYWNENANILIQTLDEKRALPSFKKQDGSFGYYPPMKLIDMIFWQLGMLKEQIETYKKAKKDTPKQKPNAIAVLELFKTIKTENFNGLFSPKQMLVKLDSDIEIDINRIENKTGEIIKLYNSVCSFANRNSSAEESLLDKCDFLLDYLPKKRKLDGVDLSRILV